MSPAMTTTIPTWMAILPRLRVWRGRLYRLSAIGLIGSERRACRPLANRRPVLQTALGPQSVEATHDLQGRALPDVSIEHFAVIPDMLDNAVRPVVGQAERFAVLALDTQQPPRFRIVGFQLLVHVRPVDPKFLGIEHDEVRPAHDVRPLGVTLTHRRTERLLGDNFRQHDVLAGFGK